MNHHLILICIKEVIIIRILFLEGQSQWIHTLPQGFIDLGHEVEIAGDINKGTLPYIIEDYKPDLAISIGWGPEQSIENQLLIKKYIEYYKVPHIYWSTEDPTFTWKFSLPLIKRMNPDYVFSVSKESVNLYKQLGIKCAYMDFGYSNHIHCPTNPSKIYKSSISIVANAYPQILATHPEHYRHESLKRLIVPLLKENIRIDFWGRHWEDISPYLGYEVPKEWLHGYVPYDETNIVYNSSNIMLGLQNYNTQLAQRTYEILASSGCLLTMDTLALRENFENGKHLLMSASPEQTLELVKHYVNYPDECKKIGMAGRDKILFGNSYKDRAEYMIAILEKENII